MLQQGQKEKSIRYTAVLPQSYVDELKIMAERETIQSINQGIRLAIASFITDNKQREYETAMREAANDRSFLKRTLETQKDFSAIDAENDATWQW